MNQLSNETFLLDSFIFSTSLLTKTSADDFWAVELQGPWFGMIYWVSKITCSIGDSRHYTDAAWSSAGLHVSIPGLNQKIDIIV